MDRWYWSLMASSLMALDPKKIYYHELKTCGDLDPCSFKANSPAKVASIVNEGPAHITSFQLSKRQLIIQGCKMTPAYELYRTQGSDRLPTPNPRQTKRAWERDVSHWRQTIREFHCRWMQSSWGCHNGRVLLHVFSPICIWEEGWIYAHANYTTKILGIKFEKNISKYK